MEQDRGEEGQEGGERGKEDQEEEEEEEEGRQQIDNAKLRHLARHLNRRNARNCQVIEVSLHASKEYVLSN